MDADAHSQLHPHTTTTAGLERRRRGHPRLTAHGRHAVACHPLPLAPAYDRAATSGTDRPRCNRPTAAPACRACSLRAQRDASHLPFAVFVTGDHQFRVLVDSAAVPLLQPLDRLLHQACTHRPRGHIRIGTHGVAPGDTVMFKVRGGAMQDGQG
jgi:hypothetical protein